MTEMQFWVNKLPPAFQDVPSAHVICLVYFKAAGHFKLKITQMDEKFLRIRKCLLKTHGHGLQEAGASAALPTSPQTPTVQVEVWLEVGLTPSNTIPSVRVSSLSSRAQFRHGHVIQELMQGTF